MVANSNTVKATETSFRVIEALAARDGAGGVSELAGDLDLSRSGVHKHLATLCELGFVRKKGETYLISDRFFSLGTRVRKLDKLFQASHEPLVDLASAMNERVSLYRRHSNELICLFNTADRNQPDRPIPEGTRVPIDDSFEGGVVTAQEDDTPSKTLESSVDELQTIRGHHIAFKTDDDVRRIAMPIVGADERVAGIVVVSGTVGRLQGRRVGEDAPGLMVSTIETIEASLAERVSDE